MSVWTHHSQNRFGKIAKALFVFVLFASSLLAQDENGPPAGKIDSLLKPGVNLIYKDPETGDESRMYLPQQMLDDVLKRALLQTPSSLFDYVELKVTGETRGDVVYLTVNLRVDVLVDNEQVAVPAGFGEFRIIELNHDSDSTAAWGKIDSSKLPVKSWILYGKGEHRLRLKLIGKTLTTTNGQQRLRLSAPVVATSSLQLAIDETVETATQASGIAPLVKPGKAADTTELSLYGLTAQSELSWTPRQLVENETVLIRASVPATMELDLTTDPGSLKIKQPLLISGGAVDEIKIKLPEKFTQVSIVGTDAEGESIVSTFLQSGDQWIVPFIRPISGPLTLEYDLGLERREYKGKISVNVPDVQGATNVSGNLEVSVPYGIDVQFAEKNTRRIRVVSPVDSRTRVTAYRMLSTKSFLDLTISETEAYFSVTPHISFETARQENILALTARFKVNVLRGSLPELTMNWPNFVQDGWRISGDFRLSTDDATMPIPGYSPDKNPDQFPIDLGEHRSGQFEVELQAFRDLKSVEDADVVLFLPDVVASTPHSTIVSLIESDADSIQLKRPNGQRPYSILPPSRWPQELRNREVPLTALLVDSQEEAVQIHVEAQEPEVRVSVHMALGLDGDRIRIQEVIQYEVRHEDISEIRLATSGRTPTVRLKDTAERLDPIESSQDAAVFSLPVPRRGKFEVLVDYFWRPSESIIDAETLSLPFVRPAQEIQDFESLTVATNAPESILLESTTDWRRIYSDEFQAAWQTATPAEKIPVRLQHGLDSLFSTPPAFVIVDSAAWGSVMLTSVTFLYEGPVDRILFSLDPVAELWGDATVDGIQTAPVRVSSDDTGRSIYQISANESAAPEQVTKVRLVVQQPFEQRYELFSIIRPALPKPLGAQDFPTTLWVMSQTSQETLFDMGSMEMTSVGSGMTSRILGNRSRDVDSAIEGMLLPYNSKLRNEIKAYFRGIKESGVKFELTAGSAFSSEQTVVVVTKRLVFLITAVLSLIAYLVCLRLKFSHVVLFAGAAFAVVAYVFAIVPDVVQGLMAQTVPVTLIAVIASLAQRRFMNERESPFRSLGDSDGNTIFAIDQPASALDLSVPSTHVN